MGKNGRHLAASQYSSTPYLHIRKTIKLSPPLLCTATGEKGPTVINH